ncbi:TonB-dependent receptor [Hirschia litorea]|uniref:TonB-dependent receptor n=1 Tax=Hirschia litorea TaxID=1199156 RepID=A0ABW2IPE4_9PROT
METKEVLDTIKVYGRGLNLNGTAIAASEGVVGYKDFEDRPLSRVGELIEVIPGVIATQHSGEGKANQYFLRGFNLDHGTDFSANIDGVPVNLRSHGHGQGYLDINFVIPELVERVDFRKGPYRASTGDFSVAGSGQYNTYDALRHDFVEVSAGEFGYLRTVIAGDYNISQNTSLLFGLETEVYDGPWVLEQDLQKLNAMGKVIHTAGAWNLEASLSAYDSEWTATDQIPRRAIDSGQIERFGFIDDDLGGNTTRFSTNGQARYNHDSGAETKFNLFAVAYDFTLYSNFTYFLDDPVNGDEFEQRDQRHYYGAGVGHTRNLTDRFTLRSGGEIRYDDITDIGLFKTASRQRVSTVRQDSVTELSLGVWGEVEYALTENLRVSAGVRADYFDADINAVSAPVNGGSASDDLLSPKLGFAWQTPVGLEFYANYGQGFHSNDVRGATISIDPVSGDTVQPVPILVKAHGTEIGARFEHGPLRATLAVFSLDLDSELVFVGDAGTTEVNDGSIRKGIEASLFVQATDWLVADFSAAYTDAEFDISGNDRAIPGAVESVIGAGILANFESWTFSTRLRHFGEAPLIEDASVMSEPTTLVNLVGSYDWRNIILSLEVLNAFNAEDNDISYFFGSQLSNEIAPVEDIHFHPVEPRQVRVSLRYNF